MRDDQSGKLRVSSGAAFREPPAPPGLEARTLMVDGDEYVVFSFSQVERCIPPQLTTAEREVVRAVVDGLSNMEIAIHRGTSPNTVANQLSAVYAKLGISGRFELIQYCMGSHAEHGRTTESRER